MIGSGSCYAVIVQASCSNTWKFVPWRAIVGETTSCHSLIAVVAVHKYYEYNFLVLFPSFLHSIVESTGTACLHFRMVVARSNFFELPSLNCSSHNHTSGILYDRGICRSLDPLTSEDREAVEADESCWQYCFADRSDLSSRTHTIHKNGNGNAGTRKKAQSKQTAFGL